MNDGLTMSARGETLVQSFENCLKKQSTGRFTTYICPAGVLTIGWGHTNANGRKFKAGDVWTQGECDAALHEDLAVAERAVRRRVKVDLTQAQFDALGSFTMNCGEGNLAKSTLLRKVNAKDFEGAVREFGKWINANGEPLNGLIRRRKAEADLFETGNHEMVHAEYKADPEFHEACPQTVDVPAGTPKPMTESKIGNAQIGIGVGGALETLNVVKGALNQANDVKSSAKELVPTVPPGGLDVVTHLLLMPSFWIAVAIIGLAVAAWVWRREHAENGV